MDIQTIVESLMKKASFQIDEEVAERPVRRKVVAILDALVAEGKLVYEGWGQYRNGAIEEEPQKVAEQQVTEDAPQEEPPLLSWTSSKGQEIEVFFNPLFGFAVSVDGAVTENAVLRSVPAKFVQAARMHGIVAMLGPVGLTREHKDICMAKDKEWNGGFFQV